jgi:3-hydroxybutyrate dehydrogenase
MSNNGFSLEEPELTADDVLGVDDPYFSTENVAVVTGAASGIGRATSVALASNGLTVVGTDIDEEGLEGTVKKAEEVGIEGEVIVEEGNLADEKDVESVAERADEVGDLRFVANVAGMQHISPISEFPTEKYDLMQSVMVRGPFLTAKHTMPKILDNDDGVGAIGNMSSVHGHYATKDKASYITAKHALTGLTRSIAAEGGGTLRGFSVSVGYVLTPLMVDQIEDTAEERGISEKEVIEDVMLGQARTKEMMEPVEVANLFVFGFSSHGRHLNGTDMLWDGGFTTTYE